MQELKKDWRGVGSLELELIGGSELPFGSRELGTELRSSARAASAVNIQTMSPAQETRGTLRK